MEKSIYPKFKISQDDKFIETYSRQKSVNGKWYLVLHKEQITLENNLIECVNKINYEIYFNNHFGSESIDTRGLLKDRLTGNQITILHDNQESEYARLYQENDMVFVKSIPPEKGFKEVWPDGIEEELIKIYNKKYK